MNSQLKTSLASILKEKVIGDRKEVSYAELKGKELPKFFKIYLNNEVRRCLLKEKSLFSRDKLAKMIDLSAQLQLEFLIRPRQALEQMLFRKSEVRAKGDILELLNRISDQRQYIQHLVRFIENSKDEELNRFTFTRLVRRTGEEVYGQTPLRALLQDISTVLDFLDLIKGEKSQSLTTEFIVEMLEERELHDLADGLRGDRVDNWNLTDIEAALKWHLLVGGLKGFEQAVSSQPEESPLLKEITPKGSLHELEQELEVLENAEFRPSETQERPPGLTPETIDSRIVEGFAYDLPPQLLEFSDEVLNDFQRIIENIRLMAKEKSLQVIGIASAVPNQGTSTLASIISLITAGKQNGFFEQDKLNGSAIKLNLKERKYGVLLIDAQLKHPALHQIFEIPNEGGLCKLLSEDIPYYAVTMDVTNSDLKLITSGELKNFRFTGIHFEKFRSLLDDIRTQFEFVFLDIPPLLHYAEGIALSKLCDGVVLVVRAGQTKWEVVQEARRLLEKADVNVLGGVLNERKFFIPDWVYRRL